MPVPVQEVASGLEQVEVPEPELQDAPEQEEVGRLLPCDLCLKEGEEAVHVGVHCYERLLEQIHSLFSA